MKNSNQGFSLVEIMIAAAALGGLALVVMNMNKTMSKSSVKFQFDSEANLITNEIVGVLADPAKCATTLLGKNALSATNILNINGGYYYISSQAGAPVSGYGSGGVKIDSYALSATNAEVNDNISYLVINYQNKKILGGGAVLSKKIKLYVEVDAANAITSCHSISAHSPEIWTRGANTDIFYSGNVGIGTNSPTVKLEVSGDVLSSNLTTGGINSISVLTSQLGVSGAVSGFPNASIRNTSVSGVSGIIYNDNTNTGRAFIGHINSGVSAPYPVGTFSMMGIGTALTFGMDANEVMRVHTDGKVGIGTTAPGYKLDVQGGDINASGSVRAAGVALTSDRRWKRNITPLKNSIEKIKQINGVSYDWAIDDYPEKQFSNKRQVGVIAQDVQAVFPELVLTDKEGFLSVNYPALVAPLIEAFKAQQQQIEANVRMFKAMQGEIEEIKLHVANNAREIAQLRARFEAETKALKKENQLLKTKLEKIEKFLEKLK